MGITAPGINREVAMAIECANRLKDDNPTERETQREKPLGLPRLAVLNCANSIPRRDNSAIQDRKQGLLTGDDNNTFYPKWKNIARGIVGALRYLISEEEGASTDEAVTVISENTDKTNNALGDYGSTDPFGNDYYCLLCQCELPNLYYSCNGCEKELDKEYKICVECLKKRSYIENRVMGLDKEITDIKKIKFDPRRHHCGLIQGEGKQPVGRKPKVGTRKKALLHHQFTEHRRFYTMQKMKENLMKCDEWVEDDVVPYVTETENRLRRLKVSQDDILNVPEPYYPDLNK